MIPCSGRISGLAPSRLPIRRAPICLSPRRRGFSRTPCPADWLPERRAHPRWERPRQSRLVLYVFDPSQIGLNPHISYPSGERTRPACCRRRRAVGFLISEFLQTVAFPNESQNGEDRGATPQPARQRRALPKSTESLRLGPQFSCPAPAAVGLRSPAFQRSRPQFVLAWELIG